MNSYNISHLSMDFQTFFHDWMARLELYFHHLLHLIQHQDLHDHESTIQQQQLLIIRQVLSHYHEYTLARAQVNVFVVLSPPWLSSYERALQWLGGLKPGLVIYVVKSTCGVELRSDQAERMERLTAETKEDERQITERLGRLEQQLLAPPMLQLARIGNNIWQGREVNGMDTAAGSLAAEMEYLVGCADDLREKMVAKVMEILATPVQTLRFLAAMAQLQLKIRRWGHLRDA